MSSALRSLGPLPGGCPHPPGGRHTAWPGASATGHGGVAVCAAGGHQTPLPGAGSGMLGRLPVDLWRWHLVRWGSLMPQLLPSESHLLPVVVNQGLGGCVCVCVCVCVFVCVRSVKCYFFPLRPVSVFIKRKCTLTNLSPLGFKSFPPFFGGWGVESVTVERAAVACE